MSLYLLNCFALFFFITFWVGYAIFARQKAKTTDCLARSLNHHRIHWMHSVITKENRVGEAALIANLERNIAFFASTTLLVVAGVLTLFAKTENLQQVLHSMPYAALSQLPMYQFKLGILSLIFIISFFKFTWSMRQYGFLNVMIGAAPLDRTGKNTNFKAYARQMAKVQDQAAHSYNYGLRAYYFSIPILCWFYHPLLSIFATNVVVYTLYNREFKSKAVLALTKAKEYLEDNHEEIHLNE